MYSAEDLEAMTDYRHILRLLKKGGGIPKKCYQIKLKKNQSIDVPFIHKYCYLIASGYVSVFKKDEKQDVFLSFNQKGEIINLPVVKGVGLFDVKLVALEDAVLWKIDFYYLRSLLKLEDPNNLILTDHLFNECKKIYKLYTVKSISADLAIRHCLEILVDDLGFVDERSRIILPQFVSYKFMSNLAGISMSHVYYLVAKLKDKGIIEVENKRWIINDIKQLRVDFSLFRTPY